MMLLLSSVLSSTSALDACSLPLASIYVRETSHTALPIKIELPEAYTLPHSLSLTEAIEAVESNKATASQLARLAHSGDECAFAVVQRILFRCSHAELNGNFAAGDDYRSVVCRAFRQESMAAELTTQRVREVEERAAQLWPGDAAFSEAEQKAAIAELAAAARAHPVTRHPLFEYARHNGLSLEMTRALMDNYYVNNRAFHQWLAVISNRVSLEMRPGLSQNFNDELTHPAPHPHLYLKSYDSLGKPEYVSPYAETLQLYNRKFNAATAMSAAAAMGGFGFIELVMPSQMRSIVEALCVQLDAYNMSEADLVFWSSHIPIDEHHGEMWLEDMADLVTDRESARDALAGGEYLLDARMGVYDALWAALQKESPAAASWVTPVGAISPAKWRSDALVARRAAQLKAQAEPPLLATSERRAALATLALVGLLFFARFAAAAVATGRPRTRSKSKVSDAPLPTRALLDGAAPRK